MKSPEAITTRFAIERLRTIAFMLRSDRPFTAGELAKSWEICRKTVCRDLECLLRLGYDFAYDPSAHRYRLNSAPPPAL